MPFTKEYMKNAAKQTGQESTMSEFKAKKQDISIFYEDRGIDHTLIGERVLSYLDIKGYSLNGPYLVVQLHDDTQYVYPMAAVSSLKLSVSE